MADSTAPPETPPRFGAGDAARPSIEQVPESVAGAMRRLHNVDVSDAVVHRGGDASELARRLHARAATRGGEVFVPSERGSLDSGRGSGLLAHELTHMLQQRRFGDSTPLDHTAAGRLLELQAQMTERYVEGQPAAPPPAPLDRPDAVSDNDSSAETIAALRQAGDELVAAGAAVRDGENALLFVGATGRTPATPSAQTVQQRAPEEAPLTLKTLAAVAPTSESTPPTTRSPRMAAGTRMSPVSPTPTPAPAAATPPAPALEAPAPGPAAPNATLPARVVMQAAIPSASPTVSQLPPVLRTEVDEPAVTAASNAVAPDVLPEQVELARPNLDELARNLYERIATRLRAELLLERERAGMLTDLH